MYALDLMLIYHVWMVVGVFCTGKIQGGHDHTFQF
jgi:hypothetical protein